MLIKLLSWLTDSVCWPIFVLNNFMPAWLYRIMTTGLLFVYSEQIGVILLEQNNHKYTKRSANKINWKRVFSCSTVNKKLFW